MFMNIFKHLWIGFFALLDIIFLVDIIRLKVKYYKSWIDWLEDEEVNHWLTFNFGAVALLCFIAFLIYV